MKRITFALCAILISLSTMAQGTLQERLKGNPKIDSLVSKWQRWEEADKYPIIMTGNSTRPSTSSAP